MIFDLDGWVQAVGRFSKGALQALACLVLGSWGFPNRIPKQELSSLYTSPADPKTPSFRHGLPESRA